MSEARYGASWCLYRRPLRQVQLSAVEVEGRKPSGVAGASEPRRQLNAISFSFGEFSANFEVGVELLLYDGLPVRGRRALSTDWKSVVRPAGKQAALERLWIRKSSLVASKRNEA